MTGLRCWFLATLTGFCALATSTGCGKGEAGVPAASIESNTAADASNATVVTATGDGSAATPASAPRKPAEVNLYPEVLIKTSLGEIRVKLDAKKAPITVENFLDNYVRRKFYEGTIVHYVAAESMAVAGGFTNDFTAKDPRAPIMNEAANGLLNKRGTIAMARDPQYAQSATSQFFFNLADNPALDHKSTESSDDYGYCVFGEVVSGIEVVDAMGKAAVHDQGDFVSTPVEPILILSVEQVK